MCAACTPSTKSSPSASRLPAFPPSRSTISDVRQAAPMTVFADIAASRAHLEKQTKARRTFVLGFCFGGRIAFLSSAEQPGLAGVAGFYGRLGTRENDPWPLPGQTA